MQPRLFRVSTRDNPRFESGYRRPYSTKGVDDPASQQTILGRPTLLIVKMVFLCYELFTPLKLELAMLRLCAPTLSTNSVRSGTGHS